MRKHKVVSNIREHSTDSTTPPQLFGKKEPFKVAMPTENRSQSVDIMVSEIDYFDVLFTKHLTQKAKTWEDGFLEYHIKGNKVRASIFNFLIFTL